MTPRRVGQPRKAFTLIEILAALTLLAIVVPVVLRGLTIALHAATDAQNRAQAATLGESKLNELISDGELTDGGASGNFGDAFPGYTWSCQTAEQDPSLMQVTLTVAWTEAGQPRSLDVSTITPDPSMTTTGGTTQ